jgi:hypothetical protein
MSRAETMGADRARSTEPWHLTRKVILLLLVVVALSLGLVLLQRRGSPAPLLLFNILADASIGIVMGLGSRALFRRRPWPIRVIVSAALSIVGLAFLGAMTGNQSGIGPLRVDLVRVGWLDPLGVSLRLPTLPSQSGTDPIDAAHMLIAIDVSWMALRAWNRTGGGRSRSRGRSVAAVASPIITASPVAARVTHAAPAAPVRATAHVRSRPMVKPRRLGPVVSRPASRRSGGAGGRRRNLLRRRPLLQIAAYEEHRCPYCLQDIKRDDVRGSVECPICHTLHHKDCWDITGTCQVPHLNG